MAKKLIKVWVGRDCLACPYGEDCGYGYNASPDCGYTYKVVDENSTSDDE